MRRRRWLKRVLITLGSLLVIGYVAIWAFLFNPLESDVDHLDGLVPRPPESERMPNGDPPLSYVVRGPALGKLWTEGFGSAHLREGKGRKAFDALVDKYDLDRYLFQQVGDLEEQIRNATGGAFEFGVLDDVLGREFLLAGAVDLDGSESEITDSPYLLLTRVTWKGKLLDVLRYDSVRERVEHATRGAEELDEGYRIVKTRYWYEVIPGREFNRDPETVQKYYFARINDVLAVSNREHLIDGAVRCAQRDGQGSIREDPGYRKSLAHEGSADNLRVWTSIHRLDREGGLGSLLAPAPNEPRSIWQLPFQIVPPTLVWDLSLDVQTELADELVVDLALAEAKLSPNAEFPEKVDSAWRADPVAAEDWRSDVVELGARDSTILAAGFAIEPADFFVLLLDQLTVDQRSLFLEELQKQQMTPEGFAQEIGFYFQARVGVVLSRLDEAVADLPLDDPEAGGDVEPLPAVTLAFRFRDRHDIGTLLDFLARNVSMLGLKMSRRPETVEGLPDVDFFPLETAEWQLPASWAFVNPVLAVRGDRFFVSTNRDALVQVLESDPASSFASHPDVRSIPDRLPDHAGMFAIVRGRKMRQLLADGRWQAAHEAAAAITESPSRLRRERNRLMAELQSTYPSFTERRQRVDEAMNRWVTETYREEFGKGLRRRRDTIESLESVRAIGFAMTLGKAKSSGRFVFDCRPAGEAPASPGR